MNATEFQSMKAAVTEYRAKIEKEGKLFFAEQAKVLFEKHPALVKFGWTQYTPYFNDGEACYFSVNSIKLLVEGQDEDEYEEAYYRKEDESNEAVIHRSVSEFMELFDDDDLETIFGDHVEVIVTKEGVEVEECNHD